MNGGNLRTMRKYATEKTQLSDKVFTGDAIKYQHLNQRVCVRLNPTKWVRESGPKHTFVGLLWPQVHIQLHISVGTHLA